MLCGPYTIRLNPFEKFFASPRQVVTLGLMIGSFMGSMEATVVATAMPTIVGEMGGLSFYGWSFSIYVLASSAGIPVAGKLSDILGRRLVYVWSMGLFLIGQALLAVSTAILAALHVDRLPKDGTMAASALFMVTGAIAGALGVGLVWATSHLGLEHLPGAGP